MMKHFQMVFSTTYTRHLIPSLLLYKYDLGYSINQYEDQF